MGDYNKVRIDLQKAGGDLNVLYGRIGSTAVAKAAPALMLAGTGILWAGQKGIKLLKERKKLIECEPELKEQFKEAVQAEMADEEKI